ncbi:regulator of chromosome condensation, putative [Perkinsus marinus ATCC 50983]|uniref:Regulator of chromosome condensation, putative n=1 Tax=Perkinsus marinus (strain ATCC 50983 / TXsc) TaxID=423536 RepID=C5LM53_PERM5|nr:regulator of chromosome condensation, putative [Perkinsus marinus ATCC 50983]EER02184.1 regulator of chromosome condensation, putative [Perkinsus marinus ATCC 50983]|eukprot:XP_002769466.1 regulator of chromosome condensation, putative [Perkinsus marinus ATCC 50983]
MIDPDHADAPPLYGNDPEEICDINGMDARAYDSVKDEEAEKRKNRERREDEAFENPSETTKKVEMEYMAPKKERRFKLYMAYHGRRGPSCCIKIRLPRHGGYEEGPSINLKKLFVENYNRLRQFISVYTVHLRSEVGVYIPDSAAITGYISYGGLVQIVDGSPAAVTADSRVFAWGRMPWTGAQTSQGLEDVLSLARKRIRSVAIGAGHALALTEGGKVMSWGLNDSGQLGTGDERSRIIPETVKLPSDVYIDKIACGPDYSVAVTKAGQLWTWGRYQASNWPRLFVDTWCNGNKPGCDNTAVGLAGSRILKVSCGDQHMLALTKEGEVFSWGYNDFGQLGWGLHGVDVVGQQRPHKVPHLPKISDIAAGGGHSVAVGDDGAVYSWGSNSQGQIGHGLRQDFAEPTRVQMPQPVKSVTAGKVTTLLVCDDADNSVIMWGAVQAAGPEMEAPVKAAEGMQNGHKEDKTEAPAVAASSVMAKLGGGGSASVLIPGQGEVTTMSIGEAHGAVVKDAALYGFGYNSENQAIATPSKSSFVPPTLVDLTEMHKGPDDFKFNKISDLACGGSMSLAVANYSI